jgi:dTDP-4-amino-4,6-dideoxygalactose transaminase
MRKDFLVFGKPSLGEEEINEVVDTLKSGWWGTGPKTKLFERNFSEYAESKYALGVNSATSGLHLALKALDLKHGDEVITTPLTFAASVNSIIYTGATPVFADVDPATWNIDPVEIEKKITKNTKAILVVHLHGRPADMDAITKIVKKHRLYLVEDAAHAIESRYRGQKIGSIGDITVFSFYVTKNLATGEGGMITTNSKEWSDKMTILRLHGLSADAWERYSVKHFNLYKVIELGYKYNMTDIAASLGIHQLARIEKNLKRRKEIWEQYNEAFESEPELKLPAPVEQNTRHAMHLYALVLDVERLRISRNQFIEMLINQNIGTGVHFYPVHLHPYYKNLYGYHEGCFPNAEFIGDRILSLPLGANLSNTDVKDVISAVETTLGSLR